MYGVTGVTRVELAEEVTNLWGARQTGLIDHIQVALRRRLLGASEGTLRGFGGDASITELAGVWASELDRAGDSAAFTPIQS